MANAWCTLLEVIRGKVLSSFIILASASEIHWCESRGGHSRRGLCCLSLQAFQSAFGEVTGGHSWKVRCFVLGLQALLNTSMQITGRHPGKAPRSLSAGASGASVGVLSSPRGHCLQEWELLYGGHLGNVCDAVLVVPIFLLLTTTALGHSE